MQRVGGLHNRENRLQYQTLAQSNSIFASKIGKLKATHFPKKKLIELMQQNLAGLNDLLLRRNRIPVENQNGQFLAFNLAEEKFRIGEWIDVKDTSGNWLEGKIIELKASRLKVHYNGWGTRWDEWIDFGLSRLAPFRTYTIQAPSTPFLSPYPQPDLELEDQTEQADNFSFDESLEYYCKTFVFY